MARHLLYKRAKEEVQDEYNQLIAQGFKPVANNDGETYSWVNKDGEVWQGRLDPTGGIDADDSAIQNAFRREGRQNKIMSRMVSSQLRSKREPGEPMPSFTPAGPPAPPQSSTTTTTTPSTRDRNKELYDAQLAALYGYLKGGGDRSPQTDVDDQDQIMTPEEMPAWIRDFKLPDLNLDLVPPSGHRQVVESSWMDPRSMIQFPSMFGPVPGKSSEKPKISLTRDIVPFNTGSETDPYIYVKQDEWRANNTPFQRAINNVWGGTDSAALEATRKGYINSPIGMQQVGLDIPRVKDVDGEKYVLVPNPNWVAPKADVVGGMLSTAQAFMMPSSVGKLPTDLIAKGKAIRDAAAAKKAAEAAKKAAQSAKTAATHPTAVARMHEASDARIAARLAKKAKKAADEAAKWAQKTKQAAGGNAASGASNAADAGKAAKSANPEAFQQKLSFRDAAGKMERVNASAAEKAASKASQSTKGLADEVTSAGSRATTSNATQQTLPGMGPKKGLLRSGWDKAKNAFSRSTKSTTKTKPNPSSTPKPKAGKDGQTKIPFKENLKPTLKNKWDSWKSGRSAAKGEARQAKLSARSSKSGAREATQQSLFPGNKSTLWTRAKDFLNQ